MDFNPSDYVTRDSFHDRFPDGEADIVYCRFCGRALLVQPGSVPDCGMHLN